MDTVPQLLTTVISPEQMPKGSVAVIDVADQLTIPIGVLPIKTEPLLVKFEPAITTLLPGVPFEGVTLAIAGVTFKL